METCPWCGSKNLWADVIDNGIGLQRVTPYVCRDCDAREIDWRDDYELTEMERETGWLSGADCRHDECGKHPELARACAGAA